MSHGTPRARATAARAPTPRACILVLGMHRSGTSALTRVLNLLGGALPSDLLGSNHSNPEGHWESLRAIEINDGLLGALGRRWDDIRELPADWLQRPETDIARQQVRAFVDRELGAPLSVLKEPRLCHLAPLWIEVLEEAGIQPKLIVPVRHPAEVAFSLARRDALAVGRSLLMWTQHVLDAELSSRGRPRVISRFNDLLDDWRAETARIGLALGIDWPVRGEQTTTAIDEFLRPALLHANARSEKDVNTRIPLPRLVERLYTAVMDADPVRGWDAVAGVAAEVRDAASLYDPGVREIAQQLEKAEHEVLAANQLLSTSIEERERRRMVDEQLASRVGEAGPLLQALVQAVESQRDELRPVAHQQVHQLMQWRAEVAELVARPDATRPLLESLARALDSHGEAVASALRSGDAHWQASQEQLAGIRAQADAAQQHAAGLARALEVQAASLEAQRVAFDAAKSTHAERADRLEAQLLERDHRLAEAQGLVAAATSLAGRLQSDLAARDAGATVLAEELRVARAGLARLRDELQSAQAGHRADLAAAEAREAAARQAAIDQRAVHEELQSAHDALRVANDARQEAIEELQASSNALAERLAAREDALADALQRVEEGNKHVAYLHQEVDAHSLQSAALQRQLDAMTLARSTAEHRTRELLASHSWRVTRPLRTLSRWITGKGGSDETASFDAGWYLQRYPDVAASGMDALEHYTTAGRDEGRLPLPPPATAIASAVVAPATVPAEDAEFDPAFYLMQYPDIAAAGLDPYQHFLSHGQAEGRQGARPRLPMQAGGRPFDADRDTVVVVSHEASRTGAPVLSLNLVQALQRNYNVVSLLLGEGLLEQAFLQESAVLAGPMKMHGARLRASLVVDQLLERYPARFVIANSIESRIVLEPFARRNVPTVSLVHEFAAYTRPRNAFREAVLWAERTVFSTGITLENAVNEFPELEAKAFDILPQGRCELRAEATDEAKLRNEDSRIHAALRPSGLPADQIVILGAGFVQQRKGVDLFVKVAARVRASAIGARCRFVWIGKGYDPVHDMGYSVYLADQLHRSGLERYVTIMGETASIDAAYETSDMLLVTSRLDPLPNVAIDAMSHGLPVLCFDKTTGIADVLASEGLAETCVADYLDSADMAEKVAALASDDVLRSKIGARARQVVIDRFDMNRYVARLEAIAAEAGDEVAARRRDAARLLEANVLDQDFTGDCDADALDQPTAESNAERYLRAWSTGVGRRKPWPGFHPGIYAEQHGTTQPGADPLVDFLRAGSPPGPWTTEVIEAGGEPVGPPGKLRSALHVHVFYPDMLADMLRRLGDNRVRPDLFVSVPGRAAARQVEAILADYGGKVAALEVVPNRGRDIGPMLTAFGPRLVGQYDVVGHMHSKKSLDVGDAGLARAWYEFLAENLLGGRSPMADRIHAAMARDERLGLVFPDDPNVVGWNANRVDAEALASRLQPPLSGFPEHFQFPVGTMFWARASALRPLVELGLDWVDYPGEPLPYDGTMLHAIERLLPFVAQSQGLRIALTRVRGVTR